MNKLLLLVALFSAHGGFSQNALLIPDTLDGTNINLNLQNGTHQFYTGVTTATMGANGNILGPTLILNQGDFVNFNVTNQIGDTTTIHWHGMHVSAENDGGPHTYILDGDTWKPSFTIMDKAGTYWYHPHLHHKTNLHVSKGIAGLILVRDADEAALALPRKYGVDDFPLVIQTKDFDANNEIVAPSNSDDIIMVNATVDPFLDVPSQVVRYRVLNGSSQRVFKIGLSGNKTFYQIASDGGLLSAPLQLTRLQLAPGERAEILIDFTGMSGQSVDLMSYASEFPNGIYGATNPGMNSGMTMNGYNPNPLNGTDFKVMSFNVGAQTANPITAIPNALVTVTPIDPATSNITRKLTFSPVSMGMNQLNGEFLINNASFDMNVINYTIPFNNTEIWELTNQSAISHPFHIHDVQFFILDRDGVPPSASEKGRKDVVLVNTQETVRFIAVFDHFSNTTVPYMYHCHMLTHEDGGMMGQFIVDEPSSVQEYTYEGKLNIFPNPTNGVFYVEVDPNATVNNVIVFDQLGRNVLDIKKINSNNKVEISGLSKGVYFVQLEIDGELAIEKIIVQ